MKYLILTLLLSVTVRAATPPIVADPKWKEFPGYLNGVAEKVQIQWERQLIEKELSPPANSTVSVTFVLSAEGTVIGDAEVKNASSQEGGAACASAITSAAPYGLWTSEMKKALGERQQLTFNFTYGPSPTGAAKKKKANTVGTANAGICHAACSRMRSRIPTTKSNSEECTWRASSRHG